MKILAVDDDDSIRELLTLQLIRHGYEVLTAADGAEAMAKAPQADFILLDLMLPKLDGFEVCRRLKSAEKTKDIPIIMLTAKAEEIDTVLGLELVQMITSPSHFRCASFWPASRRCRDAVSQSSRNNSSRFASAI